MELKQLKKTKGTVFNIQYFCIHDGPGIRSTVFLKGCQLDCLWCHNPEGIPSGRQLSFIQNKCVLCRECATICKEAHLFDDDKHTIRRNKLSEDELDASADVCVSKALTVAGSIKTAGEVLELVLRDRKYYDESGGGVTFSGGEPTLQKPFLTALLKLSSNEGLHTTLETNGFCEFTYYESILPYVKLFLIDFKETDPQKHREYTKADNAFVKGNIKNLHDAGAQILLRCPVIPGLNDRDDHFMEIARITNEYPDLLGAEILPYHKLASAKADRFGSRRVEEYETPSPATVEMWRNRVRVYGGRVVE